MTTNPRRWKGYFKTIAPLWAASVSDVAALVPTVPGVSPAASIAPPPDGATWRAPVGNESVTGESPGLTTAQPPANSRW